MNRILVADDQTDIREALRLLLKGEGFEIDTVSSPRDALEALASRHYDAVVMDMNYARDTTSGTEGLELLTLIHDRDDTMPVVLMTAWSSVGLAVEAMRTGAYDFVEKPWDNAKLVGAVRAVIAEGARRQERRQKEKASAHMLGDLDEMRSIQEGLLPMQTARIPGIEIQTAWMPALNVSGDYLDVIPLSERILAICIADVSGKGFSAALLMANIQAAVRAFANVDRTPADLCSRLNRLVYGNTSPGRFITLFYGMLDTETNLLTYSNAGHVPPILLRSSGNQTKLTDGGPGLGVLANAPYDEGTAAMVPGDHLVMMTDGITEAPDQTEQLFGDCGKIEECLSRTAPRTASALKDNLLNAVMSFAGKKLVDDATLLIVSRV